MQGLEELYLSSGMAPAEAKVLGMTGLALPMLPHLNELAREGWRPVGIAGTRTDPMVLLERVVDETLVTDAARSRTERRSS